VAKESGAWLAENNREGRRLKAAAAVGGISSEKPAKSGENRGGSCGYRARKHAGAEKMAIGEAYESGGKWRTLALVMKA